MPRLVPLFASSLQLAVPLTYPSSGALSHVCSTLSRLDSSNYDVKSQIRYSSSKNKTYKTKQSNRHGASKTLMIARSGSKTGNEPPNAPPLKSPPGRSALNDSSVVGSAADLRAKVIQVQQGFKTTFRNSDARKKSPNDELAQEWEPAGAGSEVINRVYPDVYHPGDSQVLHLPWGGKLGWARLGRQKDAGPVWVLFHGTPGSRLSFHGHIHRYAEEYGIRLYCIDRDGFGNSVLGTRGNPSDDVLGFMPAVEYLLHTQGINQFSVLGVSGGGPYALASASYFPKDRLRKTAVMCGVGHYQGEELAITFQRRIHHILSRIPGPWLRMKFYKDIAPRLEIHTQYGFPVDLKEEEQYKQGTNGHADDFRKNRRHWGFELEDIDANPIRWIHGRMDENCSFSAAEYTVRRITNSPAELISLSGEDHYTAQKHLWALFDWLRKK